MTIDFSKYKTEKELKQFCEQLYTTNMLLQNKVDGLKKDIQHAEELLKNIPVEPATEDDLKSMLLREIAYMDKLSKAGGLNIEETKQLKLVVDSLVNLERKNSSQKEEPKKKRLPNDPAKLIAMVNSKDS